MAVGESGAAFVECKDIVFVAVQIEGQGAGEVAPEQAVHEKLADFPDTGQNPLRPGHDDPLFARHGAKDGGQRLLCTRLIQPEIHEIQRIDDAFHLQGSGFRGGKPGKFLGAGQQRKDVLIREGQLQLGITIKQALQFGFVVPVPEPPVVAPVGKAFDNGRHRIRRRLGNDGRAGFEDQQGIGRREERQEQGQYVVVEHRNRDGEQTSEEVPDDGFLGEPPIDVVQRNVNAVRPGDDGEDKELVILDRQPQPVFQEQHADKVFQQGNGQPCV